MTAAAPTLVAVDPLDPRFWEEDRMAPCFIYWRDTGIKAQVDPEIYPELARYAWNAFVTRTAFKTYFRRTAADGRTTILLHREVMRLHGIEPPEPAFEGQRFIVDHVDGRELDCRKANLRWATYRENNLNRRMAA